VFAGHGLIWKAVSTATLRAMFRRERKLRLAGLYVPAGPLIMSRHGVAILVGTMDDAVELGLAVYQDHARLGRMIAPSGRLIEMAWIAKSAPLPAPSRPILALTRA
jgi:hypothetical protein